MKGHYHICHRQTRVRNLKYFEKNAPESESTNGKAKFYRGVQTHLLSSSHAECKGTFNVIFDKVSKTVEIRYKHINHSYSELTKMAEEAEDHMR